MDRAGSTPAEIVKALMEKFERDLVEHVDENVIGDLRVTAKREPPEMRVTIGGVEHIATPSGTVQFDAVDGHATISYLIRPAVPMVYNTITIAGRHDGIEMDPPALMERGASWSGYAEPEEPPEWVGYDREGRW
jgi:hypothetical protein